MTSHDKYSTQTPKNSTLFSGQYLRNRSTLDIGVLGYIGIVWPKEHSPEVWSVPPVTPCIYYKSKKSVGFHNFVSFNQILLKPNLTCSSNICSCYRNKISTVLQHLCQMLLFKVLQSNTHLGNNVVYSKPKGSLTLQTAMQLLSWDQ